MKTAERIQIAAENFALLNSECRKDEHIFDCDCAAKEEGFKAGVEFASQSTENDSIEFGEWLSLNCDLDVDEWVFSDDQFTTKEIYNIFKQMNPGAGRKDGWINVERELPEINEPLIGYNDENVQEVIIEKHQATVLGFDPKIGVCIARLTNNGWTEISSLSINGCVNITHWMPLPPPPETEKK